ncbi:unnamed protein product, partial [Effrenium voratum]
GDDITIEGSQVPVRFWHMGPIHSKSDSVILLPESKVCYTGDLLFINIAPVMWSGPAVTWVKALDDLVEATGEDWLFVPGHGPVTDLRGVRRVREFFSYLHEAVSRCRDLADPEADEPCALQVFNGMPKDLKESFHEPYRIMIGAVIERAARRAGGPAKVDIKFKLQWIGKMSEHELRQSLGSGTSPTQAEL